MSKRALISVSDKEGIVEFAKKKFNTAQKTKLFRYQIKYKTLNGF